MMDSYIHIVFAFGAVLGLLLIFYGLTVRRRQAEKGLINIIAYRILDPKRGVALAVMKIGEELLFIGVTPNDMKVLKVLPDKESITQKPDQGQHPLKTTDRFRTSDFRHLSSAIKKRLNEDN